MDTNNKLNKILFGGESSMQHELKEPIEFYNSKEECATAIILHGLTDNASGKLSQNQKLVDPILYDIPTGAAKNSSVIPDTIKPNQDNFGEENTNCKVEVDLTKQFMPPKEENQEAVITAYCNTFDSNLILPQATQAITAKNPAQQYLSKKSSEKHNAYRQIVPKIQSNQFEKTTPYGTAQKIIETVPLHVFKQKLYIYNNCYYQYYPKEAALKVIAAMCREEYECAGRKHFLDEVYEVIIAEPNITKDSDEPNKKFLSFNNGVLDLTRRILLPHYSLYFITYGIQCNYEQGECPNFERFIYTAMYGNAGLIERVYQMIGYILSPDMNGKVFFLLQGCPHSGKSLLSELLRSFFNREAVMPLDVHELSDRFAPSNLEGKALCVSPDLPSGALDVKAVSKLKQLTGNDWISADVKYQDRVEFCCRAKFVLVTNHPFVTRQSDEAFMERVVAIPFLYAVPKEQQDPALLDKLKTERSAIAFKAMQAYYNLVQNKYRFAGSYQPNTAPVLYAQNSGNMTDLSSAIYGFAMNYLQADKEGIVFMEDALNVFMEQYGIEITAQAFSSRFEDAVGQLFHAPKARKRKSGEPNAKSCFAGIRFKQY